ncbi:MAG: hypothetical protein HC827_04740 [Cyanobacteria bacterium RM1_2_2]|nr:hypothetical protein [Cyanobacteria bacterium RM1_2_2]
MGSCTLTVSEMGISAPLTATAAIGSVLFLPSSSPQIPQRRNAYSNRN